MTSADNDRGDEMMDVVRVAGAAVRVGDFFRCSWGYDQTNTDFYEVLSVSASGKTVKVRQTRTAVVSDDGAGGAHVAPLAGRGFPDGAEVLARRLRADCDGNPAFRVESYCSAYLWDCRPAFETAAGWGH